MGHQNLTPTNLVEYNRIYSLPGLEKTESIMVIL